MLLLVVGRRRSEDIAGGWRWGVLVLRDATGAVAVENYCRHHNSSGLVCQQNSATVVVLWVNKTTARVAGNVQKEEFYFWVFCGLQILGVD